MPNAKKQRADRRKELRAEDNEARGFAGEASALFTRIPARKARYVIDMIRGMRVDKAFTALQFSHRPSAAPVVERLLKTALASAHSADAGSTPETLYVSRAWVDCAGMLKRWRPRAYGRAARIRKRMSHIALELATSPGQKS